VSAAAERREEREMERDEVEGEELMRGASDGGRVRRS
jgi:hypothetical protein